MSCTSLLLLCFLARQVSPLPLLPPINSPIILTFSLHFLFLEKLFVQYSKEKKARFHFIIFFSLSPSPKQKKKHPLPFTTILTTTIKDLNEVTPSTSTMTKLISPSLIFTPNRIPIMMTLRILIRRGECPPLGKFWSVLEEL